MFFSSSQIRFHLLLGRKAMTILDSILKSRDITLLTKAHLVKAIVFPVVMYGWMWEPDYEESWALKNWCFWTVVLEKTLESPLDWEEIQPVHPKGNQSWLFIRRTDAEAETPVLWPPDAKNWLIGKDTDAGKDWRPEKKGTTEDENVGWHHQLNGHEFEQAPEVGDGQGNLAFCSPWGHKESDTTKWLNWTEISFLTEWNELCSQFYFSPAKKSHLCNENYVLNYKLLSPWATGPSLSLNLTNLTKLAVIPQPVVKPNTGVFPSHR